jgi:hypothetical protein
MEIITPEKSAVAVETLRELFAKYPQDEITDLKARIAENPTEWIHGRPEAPCRWCKETGVLQRLTEDALNALEVQKLSTKAWLEEHDRLAADPKNVKETEVCPACEGTLKSPEMGMHFGWGMAIRNYLRTNGCGEAFLGVENIDDYYVELIERAVAAL